MVLLINPEQFFFLDFPFVWVSTDGFRSTMQTRKRVLINAFTVRALRDTFSPARGAGIRTLHCVGLWLLFYWTFKKILGVNIFVCFKLLFYSLCVQCLVTPTIVVPFSLLNNLKFCCGRHHGSMCNQFFLRHHWDCNSDSSKCCCTYNWSWQVEYSSDDLPMIHFSPLHVHVHMTSTFLLVKYKFLF